MSILVLYYLSERLKVVQFHVYPCIVQLVEVDMRC